jgi:hypothetical protein
MKTSTKPDTGFRNDAGKYAAYLEHMLGLRPESVALICCVLCRARQTTFFRKVPNE